MLTKNQHQLFAIVLHLQHYCKYIQLPGKFLTNCFGIKQKNAADPERTAAF